MADVRHKKRLEQYETWAAECKMLARAGTDHSKQKQYENLSAHYSYLSASFRDALAMHGAALVLLCHKFCRCLRDDRRMQHWHRCRVIAIATANKRWMVAIELGTWRCGRIGCAAGSVTAGKGRFFDCSGAMRC